MSIKLTPFTINETIKFITASCTRKLNQVITDAQNADHADFKQYNVLRPRLYAAYLHADAELNGIQLLVLDHKTVIAQIKTAKKDLHDEWQLHDFQIVALQRPGTKPPFYAKEAA